MTYAITQQDTKTIITLSGSLDAEESLELRPTLDELLSDTQQDLIMDMGDVEFLDSSGIGMLVYAFKRLKAEGRSIMIKAVHGQPYDLMKMLHIDKALTIEPKVA